MTAPRDSLQAHWPQIRRTVDAGRRANLHCALATVSPEGWPHVTPVGTVFLRDDGTGYYFDPHAHTLSAHLAHNPRLCLMAVDTRRWMWFVSFVLGRFIKPPGVRLYGEVGPQRPATADELAAVNARVRSTRGFKGNRLIWSSFTHVRDIRFTAFSPVVYPVMTDGLW